MQLFKEHLGILNSGHDKQHQDSLVMDPVHDGFYYNVWTKTAKDNTEIYRRVFRCVPDDTGKSIFHVIKKSILLVGRSFYIYICYILAHESSSLIILTSSLFIFSHIQQALLRSPPLHSLFLILSL